MTIPETSATQCRSGDGQTGATTIPLASVAPSGSLELLSQQEIVQLRETAKGELYELFRRCALAVLNCDCLLYTSDAADE